VSIEANSKIRTMGTWFDWYNRVSMNVDVINVTRIIDFIGINHKLISGMGIDSNSLFFL
jgi:hypothetical protein